MKCSIFNCLSIAKLYTKGIDYIHNLLGVDIEIHPQVKLLAYFFLLKFYLNLSLL